MAGLEFGKLQAEAWKVAEKSGFHEARKTMEPWQADLWCALMLMVTELAEAAEELRDAGSLEDLGEVLRSGQRDNGRPSKPEGFLSELADVVIRIMDTVEEHFDTDLGVLIREKTEYNATRPFMHGRGA